MVVCEERKKRDSDKRYREDPRYKDKILQQKKEYYAENRESFYAKMREYRELQKVKKRKQI